MSSLTLRTVKGSELTWAELDANFTNLNTDKLELGATFAAGTANGVAYLNGSKALTTGSALTFDGTIFTVTKPTAYNTRFAFDATNYTDIGYGGTNTVAPSNPFYYLMLNGAEQMRLTGTGLGIGTSSPGYSLHVVSTATSIAAFKNSTAVNTQIIVGNTAGDSAIRTLSTGDSLVFSDTGKYLAFGTNGATERARIDASGNLGLGVTPSAWNTAYKAFQIGSSPSLFGSVGQVYLASNQYIDSGFIERYIATDFATHYRQVSGQHRWLTAPSGTAGNAITFTQAMTLDASGNLGIGTSSPAYKLDIAGTTSTVRARITATTAQSDINFANTGGQLYVGVDTSAGAVTGTAYANYIYSTTATPTVFSTNSVERMRLDASGNLGLGVTPSAWAGRALQLQYGASLYSLSDYRAVVGSNVYYDGTNLRYLNTFFASQYTQVSGQHIWLNAPSGTAGNAITFTQAMTLDASGGLLLGQTAAGYANANSISFSGGTGYGIFNHLNGTASGAVYAAFAYNATAIGSITQSGTTAVLYNTTSDQRLKENIQDAAPASALIDAIQVRQFDWKSDGSHQRYGFVAQELVTVAPEAVHAPADPDEMMAVDYSKLVPLLVKEIQSLRARVAQLESTP